MKIKIHYWHLTKLPNLEYEHGQELKYTKPRLHNLTDLILSVGYSVMIRVSKDNETVNVIIDNGNFRQR